MVKMIDNYTLLQVIGQGNYGKVYRGKNIKTNLDYAIKIIPSQKLHQNNKLQECTMNEIQTLTMIGQADHIIRYYEMLKTKNNYYFVYEFCNGGTLMQLLQKNHFLDEKSALSIFKQLLEAFKVLNRYNIMHRDLKPENIFFSQERVKLGDFGFCKGLRPDENMTKTMLGSPIYMAPEVLKGQPYNTKADIWSLGVILYEMLYGVCPFQSSSIAMLITTINNQDIGLPQDPKVSQKTQQLIKKMLTKDYFRRIGWVQLFGWKFDDQGNESKSSINVNGQNQNQFVQKKSSYLQQWSQRNKLNQINIKDAKDRSISQDINRNDRKQYLKPMNQMGSLGNIGSNNMILTPTVKGKEDTPSLKHINFTSQHKSFSAIKQGSPQAQIQQQSDQKKPVSLPKRQTTNSINLVYGTSSAYRPSVDSSKKIFYSQNYKDIFSTPLGDKNEKQQNRSVERRESFAKQNRLDLSTQERYGDKKQNQNKERISLNMYSSANTASRLSALTSKTMKDRSNLQIVKQKRKILLSIHQQCLIILKVVYQKLQQKHQKYLKIGFLILGKVMQKLRSITSLVNVAEIDLLDIASLINYEIIIVDRMMIDIKQQLNHNQEDIPKRQNFQQLISDIINQGETHSSQDKIRQFFYSDNDGANAAMISPKLKSQMPVNQKSNGNGQILELTSTSFQLQPNTFKYNSPNNSNNCNTNSSNVDCQSQRSGSFSRYHKPAYNTTQGFTGYYQSYLNSKQKQGIIQGRQN